MRNKNLSFVLLAAFVGSALLALVPAAEAQQSGSMTIALATPEPVKPLQGTVSFTGTVSLTADYTGVTGPVGIPVQYNAPNKPAWATVVINPQQDVFSAPSGAPGSASYTVTKTITVTVSASGDAPAFVPQTLEITGTTSATPNGNPINGKGTTTVQAAFFSIIDVNLQEAIRVDRPQTAVSFPVKVTNLGNANTKVTFDIGEGSTIDGPNALKPILPNPITLQSKQAGSSQTSTDVLLTVQTPYKNGYMNEVGVMNYKLTSTYALNPALKGDESQLSVLITTRGFYVPGPSPILFLGLVGVLALALRRFR